MQYIQGNNSHQSYFSTLEEQVFLYNAVRLIDAFIDKPELQKNRFYRQQRLSVIKTLCTSGERRLSGDKTAAKMGAIPTAAEMLLQCYLTV